MRLLPLALLLLAPLAAGCDLFGGGAQEALADRLDGTWAVSYEETRILDDGTTQTQLELPDAGTIEFAAVVRCPATGFELDGGSGFSRAYAYEGDGRVVLPNAASGCGIVFADESGERINFIATFGGDVLMTVDESGSGRQVWSRYRLFESEGYVLRTRYTLERP